MFQLIIVTDSSFLNLSSCCDCTALSDSRLSDERMSSYATDRASVQKSLTSSSCV